MYSSEHHVGRLVELRVRTPLSVEEMQGLRQRHMEVVQSVPGGDFVIVTDMRHAHVFPGEISDAFIQMMGRLNPNLLRSAILINESAIFGLQAERAVAEAGNPNRRTFRRADELIDWIGPELTAEEEARLRLFLAQDDD